MDWDKVDLKVEYRDEKKEAGGNIEVSGEDVYSTNDNEEEYRSKKTKEVIPKYLSFVKVFVDGNNLLPLNVNRETLH